MLHIMELNKSHTLPHLPKSTDHQITQTKNGSRPVSFYDNFLESSHNTPNRTQSREINETMNDVQLEGSPSQAHCLATTVPQNIVAQNIANKHTPTRNSLRHSRMIAMYKTGRVPKKYLPAIIRYHKLAKALLGLITLLGSGLCFLALWLLLWAPNIRQRDNPHWSGISVLVSGIIGLTLLCCCRKEYPGMDKNYCVYSLKVVSVTTSTVAAITALTACAFAIIHLISLYTMICSPPDQLNTTCVCQLVNDNTTTSISSFPIKSYHYVDLSCLEVDNILSILIIFSMATNFLAGVLEVWYVYLHWASRYVYTYSKVRTTENNPMVFVNSR